MAGLVYFTLGSQTDTIKAGDNDEIYETYSYNGLRGRFSLFLCLLRNRRCNTAAPGRSGNTAEIKKRIGILIA